MTVTEAMPLALAVFARAITIACALIFLTAAMQKYRHRDILPGIVSNYRILPDRFVTAAAMALPLVEVLVGITLLIGLPVIPALAGAALLLAFAGAMAVNIRRGRSYISCGCGRMDLRHPLRWMLVLRNIALAAMLILSATAAARFGGILLGSAAFSGIALWLAYQLFETIGALNANVVAMRWRN